MRVGVTCRRAFGLMAAAGLLFASGIGAQSALRDGQGAEAAKPPLAAYPETNHGAISFVQIDMNFDGQKDLVVVQRDERTSAPSLIYFLYDHSQKRFARNLALGKLPSPEFDPRTKRVRTGWQKVGGQKVSEVYGWSSNSLKLLERKELDLKTRECVSIRYAWVNDAKWELGQRAC